MEVLRRAAMEVVLYAEMKKDRCEWWPNKARTEKMLLKQTEHSCQPRLATAAGLARCDVRRVSRCSIIVVILCVSFPVFS
jgi:hypothetical protein